MCALVFTYLCFTYIVVAVYQRLCKSCINIPRVALQRRAFSDNLYKQEQVVITACQKYDVCMLG